jgi:hypothetical protein
MPAKPRGNKPKPMAIFLAALAEETETRDALKAMVLKDPQMMKELLARTMGKVPDVLHLDAPKPLVVDLVMGPDAPSDSE